MTGYIMIFVFYDRKLDFVETTSKPWYVAWLKKFARQHYPMLRRIHTIKVEHPLPYSYASRYAVLP